MRGRFVIVAIPLLLAALWEVIESQRESARAADASIVLEPSRLDVGDRPVGARVSAQCWIRNTGSHRVALDPVETGSGCQSTHLTAREIAPGERTRLTTSILVERVGASEVAVPIRSSIPGSEPSVLRIAMNGLPHVRLDPEYAALGRLRSDVPWNARQWSVAAVGCEASARPGGARLTGALEGDCTVTKLPSGLWQVSVEPRTADESLFGALQATVEVTWMDCHAGVGSAVIEFERVPPTDFEMWPSCRVRVPSGQGATASIFLPSIELTAPVQESEPTRAQVRVDARETEQGIEVTLSRADPRRTAHEECDVDLATSIGTVRLKAVLVAARDRE